jgi:tetratricopeptide (TPR) repeat protein
MSRNLRLLLTFLVCTFLGLAPQLQPLALAQDEPPAEAEDDDEEDEEEQAAKHFAAGRKLKAEGKKKEAVEQLLKAYKLRPAPPLLLYIAQVYQSMDDKKSALKYYKEYLQKARFSDPQRAMVKGEVKKLEKQVTGSTGAITSAAGTETPEAASGDPGSGDPGMARRRKLQMIHTPVDSAKVREDITVMAELPPRLEVDAVTVHFRKGGDIKFRERKMELQGESYIASIPARYVTSTSLQYYITARKGTGKRSIVAEAGAKNAPHIVVIEGGRSPTLGPIKEEAITSPYRTWIWVSGAVAVAMIGMGAVGMALSADRQAAMEKWAREKSCTNNCSVPQLPFSDKARDWESEGKSFNALGWAGLIVGGVAAGATGFLWYMDRKYVKEERARRDADAGSLRLIAAPWIGEGSAGLVGRISF